MKDAPQESMSSGPQPLANSPEQHGLEPPLAGLTSRILAYSIDYVLILVLSLLLMNAVFAHFGLTAVLERLLSDLMEAGLHDDPDALLASDSLLIVMVLAAVIQFGVESIYFIFFEMTMGGRSPGKAILKLQVLGDSGRPPRLRQSIARNLLRAVDTLPASYVVGLIAIAISPKAKRLGDLAAGTIVVRADRPAKPRI